MEPKRTPKKLGRPKGTTKAKALRGSAHGPDHAVKGHMAEPHRASDNPSPETAAAVSEEEAMNHFIAEVRTAILEDANLPLIEETPWTLQQLRDEARLLAFKSRVYGQLRRDDYKRLEEGMRALDVTLEDLGFLIPEPNAPWVEVEIPDA